MRQKLSKNMLIVKFHPGIKCLHIFLLFLSRDEISSWQKRVNSKRQFTIDRDDFILGQVLSWDEISRVNTHLVSFVKLHHIKSFHIKYPQNFKKPRKTLLQFLETRSHFIIFSMTILADS